MPHDLEHAADDAWSRIVSVIDQPGAVTAEEFHRARPDLWPTPGDAARDIEASGIELYCQAPRFAAPAGPAVHVAWLTTRGRIRHAWFWPMRDVFTDGEMLIVAPAHASRSEILARPDVAELVEAAVTPHAGHA